MNGIFIQGNSYDSVYRYERHIVFPKMLAQNCPDFHPGNTVYNSDLEKDGTARRCVNSKLHMFYLNSVIVSVYRS